MDDKNEKDLKSKFSLVFGITGLVAWFLPLIGYPVSITGLVLGYTSRKKDKNVYNKYGIVLSFITLVLTFANSILAVVLTYRRIYG